MKTNLLKSWLMLVMLLVGVGTTWAEDKVGTIAFGTNDVKINAASVTGDDDLGNTWTITTVGTTSFTTNAAYYQVGSSSKPATSITFTTTLPESSTIKSMSAKFGGFNSTAGTVALKVGNTSIGTGSLNATNDVTVNSTSSATGTVLTVTLTDIAKGVKVYNISYTIEGEESSDPEIKAESTLNIPYTEDDGTFSVTWTGMEDVDVNLYTDAECTSTFTGSWFQADLDKDNNIYYVSEENTNNSSRTVYMQLYGLDSESEEYTKVVTVTQAAAPNKYAVNITAPENGTLAVTCNDVDVISGNTYAVGQNINIVATPADGYKFRNIQVVDETTHTFTSSNEKVWNMGEHEISITANFDEIQYYTINYMVNGVNTNAQENVIEGTALVFPTPTAIGGKQFMGWVETEIDGTTNVAPSYVNTTDLTATANKTYYAVFVTATGSPDPIKRVTLDFVGNDWRIPAGASKKTVEESKYTYEGYTITLAGSTGEGYYIAQSTAATPTKWALLFGKQGAFLTLPQFSFPVNKIVCKKTLGGSPSGKVTWNVYSGDTEVSTEATGCTADETEFTISKNNANDQLTIKVTNANNLQISSIDVYEDGMTYSDYCTTVDLGTGTITIAAACTDGNTCYSTYSNVSAWVVPEGLTVSTVGVDGEGKLDVNSYNVGDVVAANTGVMVSGTAGDHVVSLTNTTATDAPGENNLHPSSEAMTGDNLFYRLTMHNTTQIGFWWGAAEGAAFSLAANKAYLAVPKSKSAGAKPISFWFGGEEDADAIKAVKADSNEVIYNLAGQRINKMQKGINIVNGKKILK